MYRVYAHVVQFVIKVFHGCLLVFDQHIWILLEGFEREWTILGQIDVVVTKLRRSMH